VTDRHIFTFGSEQHDVPNAYVLVSGVDAEQARGIMVALYGRDWCAQYDADDPRTDAMIARHGMTVVRHVKIEQETWPPDIETRRPTAATIRAEKLARA